MEGTIMARRKNKNRGSSNRGSSNPNGSTTPKATADATPPPASLEDGVSAAEVAAVEDGLDPTPAATVPEEDLTELKKRLAGVIAAYQSTKGGLDVREMAVLEAEEKVESKTVALEARATSVESEALALDRSRDELKEQRDAVESERAQLMVDADELETLREGLVEREEAMVAREAEADAGFFRRREDVLATLKSTHDELLERNATLAEELEQARQAHAEALLERERQHRARLEALDQQAAEDRVAAERAVTEREEEIRRREGALAKAEQAARWAQEDADELKDSVREHIETRAEALRRDLEAEVAEERERVERLRTRCGELERQLEEQRDAERALSHESPAVLKKRMDQQEERIQELQTELANRPSASEAADLSDLRDGRKRWEDERRTLRRDLAQTRRQLEVRNIDVDEVELLRDRNLALKENQRLLKAALDDLRSDIDERLDKHREQPVFPELLRMDSDPVLSEATPVFYRPRGQFDLKAFANDLQHRIGRDEDLDKPDLFYNLEDIRSFLGGLAMSRLHLLQGISGIGKSSLPRRFAAAVGGECKTVSVQAGWRDRNDLLGYFNAFEGRYYESSFMQALYLAQTPKYRNRLVIVLLDEMNLSHPEQYAADVLDVLERKERAERHFELMSAQQPGQQPDGVHEGRFLPLPPNVWFVGTANHDETTKDFADKTYDRSFVLSLPDGPDRAIKLKDTNPRQPISLETLTEAFDDAQRKHASDADQAVSWMKDKLGPPMADLFGIGFGGRLESQAGRFVPVVRAAGGSLGEAVDQIVSTRLLRRIQGRHDLMEEDLRQVWDLLESDWVDKANSPDRSLRILKKELKRLGADL